VLDRGERRNSLSSSGPLNSSVSLRRLLVLLASGVVTSGSEGGTSSLVLYGVGDGMDASLPPGVVTAGAATTKAGKWTILAP
jgi:hypothetical protein